MQPRNFLALAIVGFLPWLGGCYHYQAVQVTVTDALTDAPIAGARIEPYYPSYSQMWRPKEEPAVTDANGRATINLAVNQESQHARIYVESYYFDDPMKHGEIEVPLNRFKYAPAATQPSGQAEVVPPLELKVLTAEEYGKRYPPRPAEEMDEQ